jgi:peroxiredoxin Q/BCP
MFLDGAKRTMVLAVFVTLALAGFSCGEKKAPSSGTGDAKDIVAAHHGKILVLLLGREDCPGTAKATKILDDYTARKPADSVIVRVEVPLPDEDLKPPKAWPHRFPYALDKGRALAERLEFFYYPTLYVYDREGELRFTGGCDATRLPELIGEIASEKPGATKKNYSLPLPAAGAPAPAFSGKNVNGDDVTLEGLRGKRGTLLFFGATSCPFSVKALSALRTMATEFGGKDVSFVVVNRGQEKENIAPIYSENAPGLPVVWDKSGDICTAYGVDAVPFFFLLDGDGKITQRRSFTAGAATGAVNALLGLGTETPRYKPAAAG